MTQLDLFGETPKNTDLLPSGTLVPFPLSRRRKLVMRAAKTLAARKTREGQDGYWTRLIRDLAADLRRHGADQVAIDQQLSAFHRAVGDELARGDQHQRPGGAA